MVTFYELHTDLFVNLYYSLKGKFIADENYLVPPPWQY
jgi:hypothetical protein